MERGTVKNLRLTDVPPEDDDKGWWRDLVTRVLAQRPCLPQNQSRVIRWRQGTSKTAV